MTANTLGLSSGFGKALAITTAGLAGIAVAARMYSSRTSTDQQRALNARERAALASSQRMAKADLGERQRIDTRMM